MNDSRYKLILYSIIIVILATIAIQAYWNYKNYLNNKKQLVNDVQISLDNAVDAYYTDLAEKSTMGFAIEEISRKDFLGNKSEFDSIFKHIGSIEKNHKNIQTIEFDKIDSVSIMRSIKKDSLIDDIRATLINNSNDSVKTIKRWQIKGDSLNHEDFKMLTSKVVISITDDSLDIRKIDTLLAKELNRKKLDINYGLSFKNELEGNQKLNEDIIEISTLSTASKSSFLPKNSELTIHFKNETRLILKRILTGILISTLLIFTVIACLFYLLKVIKHQKQLAEVKNDLINNITHEFKTPIATISVAIESIKDFNVLDDKEKTRTYLDMSSKQLTKLNTMVEKLLETATLDSDNLELNKEDVNITDLLFSIVEKHKMQSSGKTIRFSPSLENVMAHVDDFHLDNALNNILDNAIKYGGDTILVSLVQNSIAFTVSIEDTGNSLSKANKDKIFNKFYRAQKGDTHNVKGFGIGLYYAKKIAEKHGGTIHLELNTNSTVFKLSLPNA